MVKKYVGKVGGGHSPHFDKIEDARKWVTEQLHVNIKNKQITEGYILEVIERGYIPTASAHFEQYLKFEGNTSELGNDYSNTKFSDDVHRTVGKTHIGKIGEAVNADIPAPITNGG